MINMFNEILQWSVIALLAYPGVSRFIQDFKMESDEEDE